MGAVPKKKPSKTRIRHRRTAWEKELATPSLQPCPHCGALKLPHRVCPKCGYYKDQKVIEIPEEKTG